MSHDVSQEYGIIDIADDYLGKVAVSLEPLRREKVLGFRETLMRYDKAHGELRHNNELPRSNEHLVTLVSKSSH